MSFQASFYKESSYKNCVFTTDNYQSIRSINPEFVIVDGKKARKGRFVVDRVEIEKAVEEINSAGLYSFELLRNDEDIQNLQDIYEDLQDLLDATPKVFKYYIQWSI